MILTCPQCASQYNLADDKLGPAGRTVRCVSCAHTWFQKPIEVAAPTAPSEPPPMNEAINSLLEKDDEILKSLMQGVQERNNKQPEAEKSKAEMMPVVTDVKLSAKPETAPPVITHNPFGLNADRFGAAIFGLCIFATFILLFAVQKPLLNHIPQFALVYKTLGFEVRAPGQGLRLSEVIAEQRIDDKQQRTFAVEGKMTNMTEHDMTYPPLHVVMKDKANKMVKDWKLKANTAKIVSGETVPLKLKLPDAPAEGASIHIQVRKD